MKKITLDEFPKWLRFRASFHKRAAERGLLAAAQRGVALAQKATREAPPANPGGIGTGGAVNTARYLGGWRAGRIPNGARLFNSVPYAGVIEHGRRAGKFPPLGAVARWAQRRLGLDADAARRAAFPIARAIARRGLKGRKVLERILPQLRRFALEEVRKAIGSLWFGETDGGKGE